MVTKNFLNALAMALQSGSNIGNLPVKNTTGLVKYLTGNSPFYTSPTKAVTTNADAAGISVGAGNTAATEEDFQLAEPLTSGINLTLTETVYGADEPGYPYVQYKVTVTNTGSDPIAVKEICYKQTLNAAKYPGYATDAGNHICMLDRTVLDTPVTIAAGDAGIITYKLRTIPEPAKTVAGIPMVSFPYGTDEQIAAILDAAAAGTIDLQTDAGWRVGDMRKISVGAWTGGNSVAHAAEDLFIVISSFEDYNNCGCKMQFDFANCCTGDQRMNATDTTEGGYGATEMYTTTLPALVEALPSWLKTRLRTFSVLASAGGSSLSTIETVTGNKLALRAEAEVFGAGEYGQAGEGSQIDWYKVSYNRVKLSVGSLSKGWWLRSAYNSSRFCYDASSGAASVQYAANTIGVSPFGCI